METRTTAQLRALARSAEERANYLTASELYQLAITRYPPFVDDSHMARADINALRASAKRCLVAHQQNQRSVIPERSDPLVTTIRAGLDEHQRSGFQTEYDRAVRVTEHAVPERGQ